MRHDPPKRQAFSEHLQELRSRVLLSLIALLIGSICGYMLHSTILTLLITPLGQPVFYSSPSGGFDFVVKISLFFGFVVSLPIFVSNGLRFIAPILPQQSTRFLLVLFAASCTLLIMGMLFAYFVSLPAALYFLSSFTPERIHALISTDEYLSFVIRYLLGFGLLFQLPLIMLTVNSIKRISFKTLMGFQKWVVLLSFLAAAILTPTPDVFNQLLMALPLIALYQITIGVLVIVNRRGSSNTA